MTTATTPTVADILIAAKERIGTPEKWGQGPGTANTCGEYNGRYCAAIAIERCAGTAADLQHAKRCLARVIGGSVMDWNDKPGRKHEEVLAAFDTAIALAREEQEKQA